MILNIKIRNIKILKSQQLFNLTDGMLLLLNLILFKL